MGVRSDEGVLITGVYGAGKSTIAAGACPAMTGLETSAK